MGRHVQRVVHALHNKTSEWRILLIAAAVLALDQFSKWVVVRTMDLNAQVEVLPGFFRWVHWGNTGAAWSQFHGHNGILALVACTALWAFWNWRHQFEAARWGGQIALGCLFGGIVGNLIDRILRGHVVDFLYFYCTTRNDNEIGFPAFNVADMGITTSVVLLLFLAWQTPKAGTASTPTHSGGSILPPSAGSP